MSSRWPGKHVIGLTGNIATGKSLVRKMLEHLGAFGIDADGLSAQAMSKGAPAYQPVVETFGNWIIDENENINREALGRVVFSDPSALAKLEGIVHPIVSQAIDTLIKRATQKVIVIEAIKLLESDLADGCDSIWVTDAPEDIQLKRLVEKRELSEQDARQRINAQASQNEKVARADVVVENTGSFEEPWAKVQQEWAALTGAPAPAPSKEEPAEPKAEPAKVEEPAAAPAQPAPTTPADVSLDDLVIERGGPSDAQRIADFINEVRKDGGEVSGADVMMAFGEKAYFLAVTDSRMVGLAGWQVENLITAVDEFYLRDGIPSPRVVAMLIEQIEEASSVLQSEVSLLFISNDLPDDTMQIFVDAGYEPKQPDDVKVLVWREAAQQLQPDDTRLLTKALREDRVLKPI